MKSFPRETIQLLVPSTILGTFTWHNDTLYRVMYWEGETAWCQECTMQELMLLQEWIQTYTTRKKEKGTQS